MIAGQHQSGRIAGSRMHIVQRRVRQRLSELLWILGISVVGDPCGANREEMKAKQVQDADAGQCGRRQVRMLRHHRTHQQPTIAAAMQGELMRGCNAGLFEMLGYRDEIVEDVLLMSTAPALVPSRTELSPAS